MSQQGDNEEGQIHRQEGQKQEAGHRTEKKRPGGYGDKTGHWGPVHGEGVRVAFFDTGSPLGTT